MKSRPTSVHFGNDSEAISLLLGIHAPNTKLIILDCTYNKGTMWHGSSYSPIRMDINPFFDLDIVADFTKMPFADLSFNVIVFDPPFLPTNAASVNSSKIWETRYGITSDDPLRAGENISPMFRPFLLEAKRILQSGGIIIAKLGDIVHNHKQQWCGVDFVNCSRDVGLCPCDMLIKVRSCNLDSSKWKNVKHLRKSHSYFFVVRKVGCERK